MDVTLLWPPLLLGFAGSLHCVGMCGPLLMALPLGPMGKWQVLRTMLLYHSGRILTYAALGLLFGLLGKGLAVAGLQKGLSIFAGVFMVGMAVFSGRFEQIVSTLPGFGAFTFWVKNNLGRLLRAHRAGSFFLVGLLNGLLPCGMVYAALAGAIATMDLGGGAVFMVIFGLGTWPLLLALSMVGGVLSGNMRRKIRVLQPILLGLVGILLIQRGLHIDISLFESAVPKVGLECH